MAGSEAEELMIPIVQKSLGFLGRLILAVCLAAPLLMGADKVQVNGTRIFISKPKSFVFSGWKNRLISGQEWTWIYFQDAGLPQDMDNFVAMLASQRQGNLKEKTVMEGFKVYVWLSGDHQIIHAYRTSHGTPWLVWFLAHKDHDISLIVKNLLASAEYREDADPFSGHGGIPFRLTTSPKLTFYGIVFESILYTTPGKTPTTTPFWMQVDRSGFRKNGMPPELQTRTLQGLIRSSFLFKRCQPGSEEKEVVESGKRTIEAHHYRINDEDLTDAWFFIIVPEDEADMPVMLTFGLRGESALSKAEMVAIAKSYQPIPELWKPDTDYQ